MKTCLSYYDTVHSVHNDMYQWSVPLLWVFMDELNGISNINFGGDTSQSHNSENLLERDTRETTKYSPTVAHIGRFFALLEINRPNMVIFFRKDLQEH